MRQTYDEREALREHYAPLSFKERYHRRAETLNRIKLRSGCVDCGYNADPEALDFDHLEDKNFDISQKKTLSWNRLWAEIQKCEVRCANCHRIKTKERRTAGSLDHP